MTLIRLWFGSSVRGLPGDRFHAALREFAYTPGSNRLESYPCCCVDASGLIIAPLMVRPFTT